jgi:hypothetical protein
MPALTFASVDRFSGHHGHGRRLGDDSVSATIELDDDDIAESTCSIPPGHPGAAPQAAGNGILRCAIIHAAQNGVRAAPVPTEHVPGPAASESRLPLSVTVLASSSRGVLVTRPTGGTVQVSLSAGPGAGVRPGQRAQSRPSAATVTGVALRLARAGPGWPGPRLCLRSPAVSSQLGLTSSTGHVRRRAECDAAPLSRVEESLRLAGILHTARGAGPRRRSRGRCQVGAGRGAGAARL